MWNEALGMVLDIETSALPFIEEELLSLERKYELNSNCTLGDTNQ